MGRVVTPEIMDDPTVPRDDLGRSLVFLRRVNRWLGGRSALVGQLRRWSGGWPRGAEVTLLDLATGSADLPVAAVEWALGAGFDLRVTGLDAHATTLEFAREHVRERLGDEAWRVELVEGDALGAVERFGVGSFDYAHSSLFLHHLSDERALTALRVKERVSRRGLIWNDLVRSGLARFGVRAITAGREAIIRHDARVSVDAGWTRAEVASIRDRLDLGWCAYRGMWWAQRFTLAGERRGAWTRGA